jgi:cellulose synthase/poly-beta-1,6-N-acetylglucosamine synthase-like glycosyltransferase
MMKSAEGSLINHSFSEFTWIIKNRVRPLGLWCLGCSVQLMGTGMIFSWDDITSVSLASGHLVEDLELGLDLAAIGKGARFLPSAVVTSFFPTSVQGSETQRQRWVHGHLSMIIKIAPRGFLSAIVHGNLDYFVLLLDLIVPPLSLLGLLLASEFVLFSVVAGFGLSSIPMKISALSLAAFVVAVGLAWMKFGRQVFPIRQIGALVPAVLAKLSVYNKIFSGKSSTQWVRTERGDAPKPTPQTK